MSIDIIVKEAVKGSRGRSGAFAKQLEKHREFSTRMTKAGLTPKKQSFSIPLMERITLAQVKKG
ncbi:hypothetical protein [Parasphingorhabdus sp.]|uniref:hypothetical protein n=1 Tax=Parasphingorhabdus sp. TaxID=2709688 RepID=UPI002F92D5D3